MEQQLPAGLGERSVTVREKGGQSHRYKIGKEAVKAIQDYLRSRTI